MFNLVIITELEPHQPSPGTGAPVFLLVLHPLGSVAVLSHSPGPASSASVALFLQQMSPTDHQASRWTLWTAQCSDLLLNITDFSICIQLCLSVAYGGLAADGIVLGCRQWWK